MYDDADHDIIFFDDVLSRGRVEICVMGRYRSVCADDWGNRQASVVCRELGLAANGKRACIRNTMSSMYNLKMVPITVCIGRCGML